MFVKEKTKNKIRRCDNFEQLFEGVDKKYILKKYGGICDFNKDGSKFDYTDIIKKYTKLKQNNKKPLTKNKLKKNN